MWGECAIFDDNDICVIFYAQNIWLYEKKSVLLLRIMYYIHIGSLLTRIII